MSHKQNAGRGITSLFIIYLKFYNDNSANLLHQDCVGVDLIG